MYIYIFSWAVFQIVTLKKLCQMRKKFLFKGQLISKFCFDVFDFFLKTKGNKSTWGIIVVKSNSFVHFLEESWKNHYDFVWPLDTGKQV